MSTKRLLNMVVAYVYEVNEVNELEVLRAVNRVNNTFKVVKAVVNDGDVWISFENQLDHEPVLEDITPVGIRKIKNKYYF